MNKKMKAQAIADIQLHYNGNWKSIWFIYKRLHYHGITREEWVRLKKEAIAGMPTIHQESREENRKIRYLGNMLIAAARLKKLNQNDIGNIMKLVREIG